MCFADTPQILYDIKVVVDLAGHLLVYGIEGSDANILRQIPQHTLRGLVSYKQAKNWSSEQSVGF